MLKAGLKWRLTGSATEPPVQASRSDSSRGRRSLLSGGDAITARPSFRWWSLSPPTLRKEREERGTLGRAMPARSKGLGWASPPLVVIFGFGRDPPQEELLCQVGERALAGVDKGGREHPPRVAIRRRVV